MKGRKTCALCPRRSGKPCEFCNKCRRAFCGRHGGWDGEQWVCNHCAPQGADLIRTSSG